MSDKYFLYDPDNGFETFATQEECEKSAKESIQNYLDEGWNEDVVNVVTGIITHEATETNRVERPAEEDLDEDGCDHDGYGWHEFDYRCDYELLPIKQK